MEILFGMHIYMLQKAIAILKESDLLEKYREDLKEPEREELMNLLQFDEYNRRQN